MKSASQHPHPTRSPAGTSSQLSLESFNLEPAGSEGLRAAGGFLSGIWRAVGGGGGSVGGGHSGGGGSTATSNATNGHGTPTRKVPPGRNPSPRSPSPEVKRSASALSEASTLSSVEKPEGRTSTPEAVSKVPQDFGGKVTPIIDTLDSELSMSETASMASTQDVPDSASAREASSTLDAMEKNKSSLKLIRRMRNIGSTGITKEFWMRDDKVKECYECKQSFTTFRRKHHCRICGQIFCHRCASAIVPGERFGYPGEMRVCSFCMRIMDDHEHGDKLMEDSVDHQTLGSVPATLSHASGRSRAPTSPIQAEPRPGYHSAHGSYQTAAVHLPAKPWPMSPSQESSLEGFKKILGSSLFHNRRTTASEEALADVSKALEPFRGAADHEQQSEAGSLSENLVDPDIAGYMTDDDNETDVADHWATSPFLNFPPDGEIAGTPKAVSIPAKAAVTPSADSDRWDYGGGKEKKRKAHRKISRNDELRIEFSKDKVKRRNLSSGHAKPTKYTARAISHQISKSTLATPLSRPSLSLDDLPLSSGNLDASHAGFDAPTVELNAASLAHMRRLLCQVLSESEMDPARWEDVLLNIMLKACDSIQPDVRAGDFIDIRHYVKIKKIPGGQPRDSEYVSGVVCSKNVAHKKMLRSISNPKILLLTFALEYQRVENQFLSLEPLLSQEREHLKILVSRVAALQPDVVLVEKTVSRLALEFFLESNIVVAYNVKASVIEAIARCTQADIISSMDKLALEPRLGTCESFSIKTFMNDLIPGYRRTYLFFSGCLKELGCTIILRGGTKTQLAKIKQITDLMAFVVYNLKLETFLFRDQFAMEPTTEAVIPGQLLLEASPDMLPAPSAKNAEVTPFTRAIRPYEETILSASPHVKFPLPYLLMRLKEEEHQITHSNKKLALADVNHSDEREYIRSILDQSGGWLSSIETRAGINNLLENAGNLSPFGHQSITVLYSNVCAATTIPCQAPEQHLIEYYRGTDMTLGQYLEELCCNAEYLCPAKLCDRKMLLHFRSYAHGQGRVNVVIEEFAAPVQGMEDVILMWSFCKICNQVTPVVPMSEETWKYSFGKYLELSYYHSRLSCRADMCPHDIYRDHIRYFALKNLAVRFEYEMIELLEVVVPPKRLRFVSEIRAKLKQHDYEALSNQIISYYDSLSERMKMFTFDIVAVSKVHVAKEAMAEMSKRAISEKKYMLQLLQQTLISSSSTDILAFNGPLRVLQEKVVQWEVDFTSFVRRFLQTDSKEIRRSTAAQLKRMFADKENVGRPGIPALPEDPAPLEIEMGLNPTTIDASLPALGRSPTSATSQLFAKAIPSRIPNHPLTSAQLRVNRRMSLKLMKDHKTKRRPLEITLSLRPLSSTPDAHMSENGFARRITAVGTGLWTQKYALESPDASEGATDSFDGPSIHEYPTDDEGEDVLVDHIQSGTFLDESLIIPQNPSRIELADDVNEEAGTLRKRPASLSSMKAGPVVKDDEDDMPLEWNIISGVAGETPERELPPAINRDLRDIQAMVGERSSIMKTLTSLWTGNAANFTPLQHPLAPTEHIFPDSNVVVREDEPSSIIAFTLDSKHYKEKLHGMRHGIETEKSSVIESSNTRVVVEVDDHYGDMEETLLRETGTHIRYQFWDGPTRMNCKIFFAEQFEALRRNCGIDDKFVQSLARCMRWDVLGGKSGSTFLKSQDDRLIIKQLSRLELDALYKFAPAYFEYMSQAIFHELPTVLAKIFGFYRISYKNPTTGRSMRFDCFVMENLFYERSIARIFDLKGSMRNRHVQSTGRQNEVLLDENLVEFIYESPLFIREHSKKLLRASVWNDTLFLSKLNVMDYSLLVGIDAERNELVVGIVDFIRTFTWDKKLESWVKESTFLGGGGKEPTIVSPRQYKNRFREAMERYFLMVPDKNISKSTQDTWLPVNS